MATDEQILARSIFASDIRRSTLPPVWIGRRPARSVPFQGSHPFRHDRLHVSVLGRQQRLQMISSAACAKPAAVTRQLAGRVQRMRKGDGHRDPRRRKRLGALCRRGTAVSAGPLCALQAATDIRRSPWPSRGRPDAFRAIFPGSWINGDFYMWAGHRDDQKAWGQLAAARGRSIRAAGASRDSAGRAGRSC